MQGHCLIFTTSQQIFKVKSYLWTGMTSNEGILLSTSNVFNREKITNSMGFVKTYARLANNISKFIVPSSFT